MKAFLLLFLASVLCAAPMQDRRVDPVALRELTRSFGIADDDDLVVATQKQWLRKGGAERWEMGELPDAQKEFVLNWAREQGMYSPWKPAEKHYDKALILGSTTPLMLERMNYLKDLWGQGVRFDEVIWLTGERPLDPRIDTLVDSCPTETAAAQALWKEADLPEAMRGLPVRFIASPMKGTPDAPKRPTTGDTIHDWLATGQVDGTALFISNQPFCGYQSATIEAMLPDSVAFDVAGPGVDPAQYPTAAAAAITLDALARWIYADAAK